MEITNKKKISRVFLKVVVVNILNIFVLGGTLFFLSRLPSEALKVKTTNTQTQSENREVDATVIIAEVQNSKSKVDPITELLSGDETVISFVTSMDKLKKDGVVTSYEFPVTSEISDKTGLKGLPVIIAITGTKQNVSDTLISISKLNILLRPITLNLTMDEAGIYTAKFGGFVYTQ